MNYRGFEHAATDLIIGRIPAIDSAMELQDSANLLGLREEAYRANQSSDMDTFRARVVAWSVGKASLDATLDHDTTVRLEAVLRMPYVFNRFVTPTELDVREFVEPELTEEERRARLTEHPRAIAGMYTTYRTNPAMNRLVVVQGLLTIDPLTNRGRPSSATFGMQVDQPKSEHIPDFLLMMHTDKVVTNLNSGKTGNLLTPTESQVAAFKHELERGASGNYTLEPPIRAS